MENGAFAPFEQMLHFPRYFQILCISKASKGAIKELRVKYWIYIFVQLHSTFCNENFTFDQGNFIILKMIMYVQSLEYP